MKSFQRARSKAPIITNIPKPVPRIVGKLVPDLGKEGTGVEGVDVPPQTQLTELVHSGFRQNP